MIEKFKEWSLAKKCKYIEVSVFKSNINVYEMYKKQGFIDTKSIMTLNLEETKHKDKLLI